MTATPPDRPANRLAGETSPYLLQHAYNPVDWRPWGDEALAQAREEDKPIFLSIGYSACHWCHVMEHESFENEEIAAYLNEHFVSIKVDREERPDLDDIYMTAVQIMTGRGGWPMTVFLTPDLKPFYGGTYYPPFDRQGMPGFLSVLRGIQNAWSGNREGIAKSADQLTGLIRQNAAIEAGDGALTAAVFDKAAAGLKANYDLENGGWGGAPKFPSAPTIRFLLRHYRATGDKASLGMADETLRKMAWGGMYDHIGGGFHRYAVDDEWLVPHFEKMLYDNGQLTQAYIDAYQLTGDAFFARIARQILDYQLTVMTGPEGAFHSAEDADSEGEEGKFYVWTHDEIAAVLGDEDAKVFCAYYSILPKGNFSSHEPYHRGMNIPHMTKSHDAIAEELGIDPAALLERIDGLRATLLAVRAKRVRPGLDDKVITSWNGLMIAGMARAARALDEPRYAEAAAKAADFILTRMRAEDGLLFRTHRNGDSRHIGYLDDHANMALALIELYQADFNARWLDGAVALADAVAAHFADESGAGFYFTADVHTHLIARQKPTYDGSEPSGNSMATLALLRLAALTGREDLRVLGEKTLAAQAEAMTEHPGAYMAMLEAAELALRPGKEIALIGPRESETIQAFRRAIDSAYLPNTVLVWADGAAPEQEASPLLKGRGLVNGTAAAYVCENFTCQAPVTGVTGLKRALAIE